MQTFRLDDEMDATARGDDYGIHLPVASVHDHNEKHRVFEFAKSAFHPKEIKSLISFFNSELVEEESNFATLKSLHKYNLKSNFGLPFSEIEASFHQVDYGQPCGPCPRPCI